MSGDPDREVLPNAQGLQGRAAELFSRLAAEAVRERGSFSVALSGGSTPRGLYALLAREPFRAAIPWASCRFFWGDERHVPPDHPESNYRMARESLLSKVPVPESNVHRVPAELPDAGQAAERYEEVLRESFALEPGQPPRFDLVLLGLGPDGHTASLFPGTAALAEKRRLVVANRVEKLKTERITMTYPVLNNAANVVFVVSGRDKAEAVRGVLEENAGADPLPAALVRPARGELLWLLDAEAASLLAGR
jgi:6-phosphogluconolactonase